MGVSKITIARKIFTVSEITCNIKKIIEDEFPFIWISGEISNFKIPGSGHYYFTLKDKQSQISAVMFRGQNRKLQFLPEDGLSITGFGRISLYEPRGVYQIILEHIEPAGAGALSLAFEQLKERLFTEGLFDDKYKASIPFLPKKITLITSPTGAVVHDIIKIVKRRFHGIFIEIIPVNVQGDNAVKEIVAGLKLLNTDSSAKQKSDAAIIARGGGSAEDLSIFNSEEVARAIFASKIPVISAIGHETDFTIADFVADLRAPTPSAAAELIVPLKEDLKKRCFHLTESLKTGFFRRINYIHERLDNLSVRLTGPGKMVDDLRLKTDDYSARMERFFANYIFQNRKKLAYVMDMLHLSSPAINADILKIKNDQIYNNLVNSINIILINKKSDLKELTGRLYSLSPIDILSRGYSIIRTIPDASVVTDSKDVSVGQKLNVMLAKGSLICRIERKNDDD